MDKSLPITFRSPTADDYPFIIQTWGRIYRENYPINMIPAHIYFESQNNRINLLLSTSTTMVACMDDSPNEVVGYIVFQQKGNETLVVHWAHVKGIFRRLGICKALLEQAGIQDKNLIVTHHFSLLKTLKDRYGLIFDPTLLENNAT